VSGDIGIECAGLFASRLAPTEKTMYGLAAAQSVKRLATLINADTYFGRFDLLLACLTL
jgi:hypothetical protein